MNGGDQCKTCGCPREDHHWNPVLRRYTYCLNAVCPAGCGGFR